MKLCWYVGTWVVMMARMLSASGWKLLLKASKYTIKYWHASKWILYTRRTKLIDMKWYGVEVPRVLYHYTLYAYFDYLQRLSSDSISTFQLTSRDRSRHYMELTVLPSATELRNFAATVTLPCYWWRLHNICTVLIKFNKRHNKWMNKCQLCRPS